MNAPIIDKATPADIAFLADAVQGAEQSGGTFSALARIFGIAEDALPGLLSSMFEEGVDGCEFSVSSFLVVREGSVPVAAVAGWVEGEAEEGVPSQVLRSNLIGFTFPPEAMAALRTHAEALTPLRLDRVKGALQIEYVYVRPDRRGSGLAARLIQRHIMNALALSAPPARAQVQVFANNAPAVHLYSAMGFTTSLRVRSDHPGITSLLPHPEKLMMEKLL